MISGRINQVAVVSWKIQSFERNVCIFQSLCDDQTIIKRFFHNCQKPGHGFHSETTQLMFYANTNWFSSLICQVCLVNLQSAMAKLMIFHIVFQIPIDSVGWMNEFIWSNNEFFVAQVPHRVFIQQFKNCLESFRRILKYSVILQYRFSRLCMSQRHTLQPRKHSIQLSKHEKV